MSAVGLSIRELCLGYHPPAKAAPGPTGNTFTILSHLRRDPIGFFMGVQREYGDIVRLQFGPFDAYLLCHPDGVQRVLQDNNKNYDRQEQGYRKLKLALGDGLLTTDGSFWQQQRRI